MNFMAPWFICKLNFEDLPLLHVGPSNFFGLNPLNDLFRMADANLNAHKDFTLYV